VRERELGIEKERVIASAPAQQRAEIAAGEIGGDGEEEGAQESWETEESGELEGEDQERPCGP
jgi:hypothetical protein